MRSLESECILILSKNNLMNNIRMDVLNAKFYCFTNVKLKSWSLDICVDSITPFSDLFEFDG